MTIVAAKRIGQRIIVLSDTMISNVNARTDNIIPGRLKSIILNQSLTISYAGLSSQAMDAIRMVYRNPPGSLEAIIDYLANESKKFEGELDFIVCSHENNTELFKISAGSVLQGADFYWIGNPKAVSELSQLEVHQLNSKDLPEYFPEEELQFTNRFIRYLDEGRCPGVGGVVINCLCSAYGHCYQNHGNAFAYDTIVIGQNDDYIRRQEINKTGMHFFEYNVYSAHERGQAIVGLFLGQSNVGFIYDPLNHDDAEKITGLAHSDFANFVGSRSVA